MPHPNPRSPSPIPFWRVLALCLAAAFLLRLPTLFRAVLDWDESLYLLMAQQWLHGHLPYTTIWDNKPLGIYAIFALFIAFFHNPVIAIRLATILFDALTAAIIWRLTKLILPPSPPALARRLAGLAAAAFIAGSLSNDGLSANTELFMECFSAAAILTSLLPGALASRPLVRGACTGLLFGCACMTKYVAVFEAPAIAFALLFSAPAPWRPTFAKLAGAALGAALIPAATIITYAAAGQLGTWWQCSILSNLVRVDTPIKDAALHDAAFIILPRWLPCIAGILFLLAAAPRRSTRSHPKAAALLLLWLAGAALGIVSAKSFYDHYFLQMLPVSCLCLAWSLARLLPNLGAWPRNQALGLFAALLLIPAAAGANALRRVTQPLVAWHAGTPSLTPDPQSLAAAALRPQIAAGATLYVFDAQPILYALTNAQPPTSYVLPSILTRRFLAKVAGIDPATEVARVIAQNPTFIVRSLYPPGDPTQLNHQVYTDLATTLAAHYTKWHTFPGMEVYRHK